MGIVHSDVMKWKLGSGRLPEAGEQTLLAIVRSFAAQPFTLEQLDKLAGPGISGAELRAGLITLRKAGVLSAVRKSWGERLYYLTGEVLAGLQDQLLGSIQQEQGEIRIERSAGDGMENDLFRILVWIGKHGLPVTAKGTIHQKARGKLAGLTRLASGDLDKLRLHYPHRDVYSAEIAVLLDLLLGLGLVTRRDSFVLEEDTLAEWFALSPDAMRTVIYGQLLSRYIPPDPNLQQYVYSLGSARLQEDSWYLLQNILDWLQGSKLIAAKTKIAEEQEDFMTGWLNLLCGFGFMDLGANTEGKRAFRWRVKPGRTEAEFNQASGSETPSGPNLNQSSARMSGIYVQPDFEILVPEHTPYTIRWELEICSEFVSYDVMSVYRLSRSSSTEAYNHGRTPADTLAFLEQNAAAGVPENVQAALKMWDREMGRTAIEEHVLLRCRDSEAAEAIAAHFAGKLKLERIGPLNFIVPKEELERVRKGLMQLEMSPRMSAADDGAGMPARRKYPKLEQNQLAGSSTWSGRRRRDTAEVTGIPGGLPAKREVCQGLIVSGAPVHIYEPDGAFPSPEELFPGMEEVPAGWLKEMRNYHPSTSKSLIRQALAWKTKILLRLNGETAEFLPLRIFERDPWTAEMQRLPGGEAVELTPAAWEAIRLELPSIIFKT